MGNEWLVWEGLVVNVRFPYVVDLVIWLSLNLWINDEFERTVTATLVVVGRSGTYRERIG